MPDGQRPPEPTPSVGGSGALPADRLVLERLHARPQTTAHGALAGVSLRLGAGIHAVLGRPADGTALLVDVVAGRLAPRTGRVLVDGRQPARDRVARTRIGVLGAWPALAPGRTVAASVRRATAWRGDPGADPLGMLGIGEVASRRLESLTLEQARAVELALALSLPNAAVVALYEPRCQVAALPGHRLRSLVRERADAGGCVLVATSSPRDAADLGADDLWVLVGGRLVGAAVPGGWGAAAAHGETVVWVAPAHAGGARALALGLGARAEVSGVGWQAATAPGEPDRLVVRSMDGAQAALAIAEEATRLGTSVLLVQSAEPGLDDLARWARERLTASEGPQ